jgi:hypothetical protein
VANLSVLLLLRREVKGGAGSVASSDRQQVGRRKFGIQFVRV